MLKKIGVLVVSAIICGIGFQQVYAFTGAGAGTAGSPYEITTCNEFTQINSSLSSYYLLKNNLDCSSLSNGIMAGTEATPFTGNFNGAGYTITMALNGNTNGYTTAMGLFRSVNNATVSDLRVKGYSSGYETVGGIAGIATGNTILTRVINETEMYPYMYYASCFGGIVGKTMSDDNVIISDSYNTGKIGDWGRSSLKVGGIVGCTVNAKIRRTYNRGLLVGSSSLGGIVGSFGDNNASTGEISDSFNVGILMNTGPGYYTTPVLESGGVVGYMNTTNATPEALIGTLTNNFYDKSRSTYNYCLTKASGYQGESFSGACGFVNASWNENDYFKSNSTNHPFVDEASVQKWDFTSTWETVNGGYPALRSVLNDEVVVADDIGTPIPAPTAVHTTALGKTYATVAWTTTYYNNLYSPLLYDIFEYKKSADTAWSIIDTRTLPGGTFIIGAPSIALTNLVEGTEYQVRIKGMNTVGDGIYSDIFTFSTKATPILSSPPTGLTITPQSNPLLLDLTWVAPTDPGNLPITSYMIQVKYTSSTWDDIAFSQLSNSTTTSYTGLSGFQNGKSYDVRVLADNAEGVLGQPSESKSYQTPAATTHIIRNCTNSTDENDFGLQAIGANEDFYNDTFELGNNIDCTGVTFLPITYTTHYDGFEGVLDGKGYTISNLVITATGSSTDWGLFSYINGATFKDFTLNVTVHGNTRGEVGGLAGWALGHVVINNVTVGVQIDNANRYVGGMLGEFYASSANDSVAITNSHVSGHLNSTTYASTFGGLVGQIYCNVNQTQKCAVLTGNTVDDFTTNVMYAAGGLVGVLQTYDGTGVVISNNTVAATLAPFQSENYGEYYGGLIGEFDGYRGDAYIFTNNTTSGSINANETIGGIAGAMYFDKGMVFDHNSSSMVITGADWGAGGLVGDFENNVTDPPDVYDTVTNSFYTGSISANEYSSDIGGLFGYVECYYATIKNSFSTGNITTSTGSEYIGGLAGEIDGGVIVEDSYAAGNVIGTSSIGGITGYIYADNSAFPTYIRNSYVSGNVTGDDRIGGLVGDIYQSAIGIENAFFAGTLTVNSQTATNAGALVGGTSHPILTFSNNTYDASKTGTYPCVGAPNQASDFESCQGVNADGSAPNYFKYNTTNEPMASWNFSTVWRKVPNDYPKLRWNVVDSSAPVLTLLGSSAVKINKGAPYTDAGATAVDDFDGDITDKIVVTNPVNINTVGTYYVLFNVCDGDHNCAAQLSRRVDVVALPVIAKPVNKTGSNATDTENTPVVLPKTIVLKENTNYVSGASVDEVVNSKTKVVVTIDGVDYTLNVTEVGVNYFIIGLDATSQHIIEAGQTVVLDINGDGKDDITITGKSIVDDIANVLFQKVQAATPTPSVTSIVTPTPVVKKSKNNTTAAWMLVIIISVSVAIYGYKQKRVQ